jgi:hypothetical protein
VVDYSTCRSVYVQLHDTRAAIMLVDAVGGRIYIISFDVACLSHSQ